LAYHPPQDPWRAGLAGKCPRCGVGELFSGYLTLAERCPSCGLDYARADSGDGPAVFVIFIVGFVGVASAMILRYGIGASILISFLVSAGLSVAVILALLRPLKGVMIALQFRHKAAEGRLEDGGAP